MQSRDGGRRWFFSHDEDDGYEIQTTTFLHVPGETGKVEAGKGETGNGEAGKVRQRNQFCRATLREENQC